MAITINPIATDDYINAAEAGSATITGTNAPGVTVGVTIAGVTQAATVSGTSWSYTLTSADISRMNQGVANNISAQDSNGVFISRSVILDTVAPTATALMTSVFDNFGYVTGNLMQPATMSPSQTSGATTDDIQLALSGTISGTFDAAHGDVVAVYDGVNFVGDALVNGTTWSMNAPPVLQIGATANYHVRVEDLAGNTPTAYSPTFTTLVDRTAPISSATVTGITDDQLPVTGAVGEGLTTNDPTPIVVGTTTASPGDVIHISREEIGGTKIVEVGSFTVVTSGAWTFTDNLGGLINQTGYRYQARVGDAAGNIGITDTGFNIVSALYAVPPVVLGITPDLGASATDGITSATAFTIFGSSDPNSTVSLYKGGVLVNSAIVADSVGNWAYNTTAATGTTSLFTATQKDPAGNISFASTPFVVLIDTVAPVGYTTAISTILDNVGTIQGNVSFGGTTDDLNPEIQGTISAPLGSDATGPYLVGVYATITDGITTYPAVRVGTATMLTATTWTFTDTRYQGDVVTYQAKVEDQAGNGTLSAGYNVTFNAAQPQDTTGMVITDNVGPLQGDLIALGQVATDDTTLVLSGTIFNALQPGDMVVVYASVNGGPMTARGLATVNPVGQYQTDWTFNDVTRTNGDKLIYAANIVNSTGVNGPLTYGFATEIDIQGSINAGDNMIAVDSVLGLHVGDIILINGAGLDDGILQANITAIDSVNNIVTLNTTALTSIASTPVTVYEPIIVDTVAPTATAAVTQIIDNQPLLTGVIASGGFSNDSTPQITGTLSAPLVAGDNVHIFRNGADIGLAAVTGTTWSLTDTSLVAEGTYSYQAEVIDNAGNFTPISSGYSITLDLTPPSVATASRSGSNITFTFTENLLPTSVPSVADFTGKKNGVVFAITNPVISGNTLTLTAAAGMTTADVIEVTYTPGTNPLVDMAGNLLGAVHLVSGSNNNETLNTANYTTAGTDVIIPGTGIDTIDAGDGNDVIVFSSMAAFLSGGNVIDSITGGNGTDKLLISGPITLLTTDSLARVNTVEILGATPSTSNFAYNIAINDLSSFTAPPKLGSIRTIDLSANQGTGSTAVVNLTLYPDMTILGVSNGTNTLTGGAGNDSIVGGSGNDVFKGGPGADTIIGGGGNDTYLYDLPSDFVSGGVATDSIVGGNGNSTAIVTGLLAVASTDDLSRISGVQNLVAAPTGVAQPYSLVFASDGTVGSFTNIDLSGNTGVSTTVISTIDASNLINTSMLLKGVTSAPNSLIGGEGNDTLYGGSGNDTLTGGNGSNLYYPGAGNDSITGGGGNDDFEFTAGNLTSADTVIGGASVDTVHIGGNTAIVASTFNNVSGIESIIIDNSTAAVAITTAEPLVMVGAQLTVSLPNLTAPLTFNGAAELGAGVAPTGSTDSPGRFSVTGGTGNDLIIGGAGNDTLTGGPGIDTLTGGAGNDTFVYNNMAEFMSATAVIDSVNGTSGTDTILIYGPISIATTQSMARVTNVQQLVAAATTASQTHSISISSNTSLSSLRTFDLSGDTSVSSSATFNMTGVTNAVKIVGVLNGTNSFTGTSGNDTMIGGNGNDYFNGGTGGNVIALGGAGNDTFGFAANTLSSLDTLDGGIGYDTLNLTGNTAIVASALNNVSNIEQILLGNTNTTVAITTLDTLVAPGATLTISNAANTAAMTFNGAAETAGTFSITGGSGNDVLTGGFANDTIASGNGNDTITGGFGADVIYLTKTVQGADVVKINVGDSALLGGIDKVYSFNVSATTAQNDRLDLPFTTIAANGAVNGTDVSGILSHSVTSGMISFDNVNQTFTTPVVVNASNLAAVDSYVALNIAANTTVAFYVDANGNGTYNDPGDFLRVFQAGSTAAGIASYDDTFVDIYTTTGLGAVVALGTVAAANTLVIL